MRVKLYCRIPPEPGYNVWDARPLATWYVNFQNNHHLHNPEVFKIMNTQTDSNGWYFEFEEEDAVAFLLRFA